MPSWITSLFEILGWLKEIWDKFKPIEQTKKKKSDDAITDESRDAKENADARPKYDD